MNGERESSVVVQETPRLKATLGFCLSLLSWVLICGGTLYLFGVLIFLLRWPLLILFIYFPILLFVAGRILYVLGISAFIFALKLLTYLLTRNIPSAYTSTLRIPPPVPQPETESEFKGPPFEVPFTYITFDLISIYETRQKQSKIYSVRMYR